MSDSAAANHLTGFNKTDFSILVSFLSLRSDLFDCKCLSGFDQTQTPGSLAITKTSRVWMNLLNQDAHTPHACQSRRLV
jgi:hypothetical protein